MTADTAERDAIALLPCPFCGGVNVTCIYDDGNERHFVACLSCDATCLAAVDCEEACDAWNTRTAARAPSPAVGEWQPIETAPKDGRYIIAGLFKKDELIWVHHSRWMTAEEAAENEGGEKEDYDCGWTDGEDEDDYSSTPNHWMPLPTPPARAEGSR